MSSFSPHRLQELRLPICRWLLASGFLVLLAGFGSAFAQEQDEVEVPEPVVQAVITGPRDTAVGRTVILDASASQVAGGNVQYEWYVNGARDPISRSVDAIYTPEQTGELRLRLVVRAIVSGQPVESETTHTVIVYRRKVVLVTDASVPEADVDRLRAVAASGSAFLSVIRSPVIATEHGGEEAITDLLADQADSLLGAQSVILWTDGTPIPGLQALMRVVGDDQQRVQNMQRQALVLITDLNLHSVARVSQGSRSALTPKRLLIARPSVAELVLSQPDDEAFFREAKATEKEESLILDAATVDVHPVFALTRLTNYMMTLGVSSRTLLLLLVLPIIATILSFLKQVVGVTTFGLFTPSIIALSFIVLGWWVGLLFLLFIVTTGYASRAFMRRWHLLYIPKMAIILTIGSFTLLLLVGLGTAFGALLSSDTVFVLLIMSTLVESFLNVKSEQGLRSAVLAIGQTILAALLCVVLVQWPAFQTLILAYPELLLLTVVVNILLGRWTGLRISEYFRFREVFKHLQEE